MGLAAQLMIGVSADISAASKQMTALSNDMRSLGESAKTAGAGLKTLVTADLVADGIKAIAGAMFETAKSSLKLAGDLEQSKIAFTTMLGSAEAADKFLRELANFAANTPFELAGLQESSKKLLAFGFDARDVIPMMTAVGDAVAAVGGGAAKIDRVTTALGQMQAKGKVSAEEMLQLTEAGIPAWDMLAKKIGVSVPEAMKMAEKGTISSGAAINAVVEGMEKRWGGMMEQQSKTFLGAWSNMEDGISRVLTNIGTDLIKTFNLTPAITLVSDAVSALASSIESSGIAGTIAKVFGPEVKAGILGIATAITVSLIPTIIAMAPAWATAASAAIAAAATSVAAWTPMIALAAAIAFAATPIIRYWDDLAFEFGQAFDFVKTKIQEFVNGAKTAFNHFANSIIMPVVRFVQDKLAGLWAMLPEGVKGALKEAGVNLAGFGKTASGALQLAGVELGAGAKFVVGNMRESFSGFEDVWKVGQEAVKRFQGVATNATKGAAADIKLHLKNTNAAMATTGKTAKQTADDLKRAMAEAAKVIEHSMKIAGASVQSFVARADVMRDLKAGLKGLQVEAGLFGNGQVDAADKAQLFRKAAEELLKKGLSPQSPQIQALAKQYRAWTAAAKDAEERQRSLTEATKSLSRAGLAGASLGISGATRQGEEFRVKAQELQAAIEGLRQGLSTVSSTLGIEVNEGFSAAIAKTGEFILALGQIVVSVQSLIPVLLGGKDGGGLIGMLGQVVSYVDTSFIPGFGQAIGAIVPAATGAMTALGNAIAAAVSASGPIGIAVFALMAAGALVVARWDLVGGVLGTIFNKIGEGTRAMFRTFSVVIMGMADSLMRFLNRDFGSIAPAIGVVEQAIVAIDAQIMGLGDSIGKARENVKKFEEQMKRLQGVVSSGVTNAFSGAMKAFLDGTQDIHTTLKEGIRTAIIDGFVAAMMEKAIFQGTVGKMLDKLVFDTLMGKDTGAQVKALAAQAARDAKLIEQALTPMKSALESAFGPNAKAVEAAKKAEQDRISSYGKWAEGLRRSGAPASAYTYDAYQAAGMPAMARGGLVTGPTAALVGEGKWPEVVAPLSPQVFSQLAAGIVSQMPAMAYAGGGGNTYEFHYHGDGDGGRFTEKMGEEFVRFLNRKGIKVR